MNNFSVGDRVVCINDKEAPLDIIECGSAPGEKATKGQVYTVANAFFAEEAIPMIELTEVYQPGNDKWLPGFKSESFRLAEESPKFKIKIFQEILDKTPKILVDAC